MNLKRTICYFICIILSFGIIGSGCSKKEEKTVDNSNRVTNEPASQENPSAESDKKAAESEVNASSDTNKISEESPWQLISESTVETRVNYAGFLNESIGVTVGYSGATSYTEDGGKSWSKSSNVSACRYGLDLYDESFIIDSGNSGVNLVSKDKGKTWTYLAEFPLKSGSDFNKYLSVPDTENIYIGASRSFGVTNDGGLTWKELNLPEGCTMLAGMYFITPETGYLLDREGILYKTNDSCKTWTSQTIDLAGEQVSNNNMPTAAINFKDEDYGMIIYGTKSYKLFCLKTEDGGSNWESVTMPDKITGFVPYLSRDGKYLTLSSPLRKIRLYKLEE